MARNSMARNRDSCGVVAFEPRNEQNSKKIIPKKATTKKRLAFPVAIRLDIFQPNRRRARRGAIYS